MGSEPPAEHPVYVYVPRPTDGEATAALVVGILALVSGVFCYGIPSLVMGPVAIYLGLHARGRINASGGTVGGYGFAQAGWICGLVAIVFGALLLLLFVGFFSFMIWFAVTHPPSPTPSPAV